MRSRNRIGFIPVVGGKLATNAVKKTKNSNVDYRTHISDILGNHYYPGETIHPVELEYGFEHQGDNEFKLTRLEKNSTGRGI